MAANKKMPIRKRKAPAKTSRLKARRARRESAAARKNATSRELLQDVIDLAEHRCARSAQPDVAVGDGLDRRASLRKGHSAQIMLFTGVQIVRDTGNA